MSRKTATLKWYAQAKRGTVKCGLHPLIHTRLEFNLAQYIVTCEATVGICKKPPLARTASRDFGGSKNGTYFPLTFLEYQAIEKEKA